MLKEGVMHKPHNSHIIISCLSVFAFLIALTTVSALILSSSPSHAETSSVLASVTVPDVCTLRKDNSSTEHTATSKANAYIPDIGETVINVSCNDVNGFSIYAVGYSNDTVGNTNLIGETTGSTIPTGTDTSKTVSNWAMKLTPVTGAFTPTILNDYDQYHTVPSTATKVATRTASIDVSAASTIKTTYAVALSPAQTRDTYNGKVKYTVVHPNYANADGCVETITGTMQGVGHASLYCDGASGVLTDSRDSKTYAVKKINGALWMTQNLRYLGDTGSAAKTMTIGNKNSNVANTSITLYSLDSSDAGNFNAYSGHCNTSNGYNYACVYDSGDTTTGVWYNYYAATAGTIKTDSNQDEATSDICPKNWHLPSYNESSPAGSINNITSQSTAFSPVPGGFYVTGSLTNTTSGLRGLWWSSTAGTATYRFSLGFNGSILNTSLNVRYVGFYVRCTRTS